MNRSTTSPHEPSSRCAEQGILKETFGKKAEQHLLHEMASYLETNLLHPHSVVLCSPLNSTRATIRPKNLLVFVSMPSRITGQVSCLLNLLG